ncbi:divergent polysaccharide deacetylase family protein [Geomonas sp. RF6]|uniref:divergent polysaccharide deacetylase family protein n=1 Tax=Geomonas sp. RF6 TaxID=2897342 RepID=UPI001E33DB89|nr:divergent polysaccharide deacetylase family protein [Geomonas sp. RF6]UFS70898.1 divergent polysaccharide deacetylase family protein [Geomonas sp. RF6]
MATGKKSGRKGKPSGGGRPPYLALAVVVAIIVVAILLLERTRSTRPVQEPRPHPPVASTEAPAPPPAEPAAPAAPAVVAPSKTPMPRHAAPLKGHGSLAIIVDDMGANMQEAMELLSIDLPITFSVIPSLAKAAAVAEAAHGAGEEVMVHMPMEPQGYPKQRLEKIGLLVSMDEEEIERRVNGYFAFVPHAVGANNHMGSRFTERLDKMAPVLKVLKEHGVFFVDSLTSPASVGYKTARAAGLKCGMRQVFLDNVQDVGAIRKQLAQAAAVATKRGAAIAICHPHPATIKALKEMMPELKEGGIQLVHASDLVS